MKKNQAEVETLPEDYYLNLYLRIIFSHLLFARNGFMLHSSGVTIDDRAFVFIGPAGSGKSTIINILKDEKLLADELIAFHQEENLFLYGTPFYQGTNLKLSLNKVSGLFFLKKADEERMEALTPVELSRNLFMNIEFGGLLSQAGQNLLDLVSDLCRETKGYNLYFRKEPANLKEFLIRTVKASV